MERSVEVIRDRVDKLGVAEPEIRRQGDDQIAVALPGRGQPGPRPGRDRLDREARALRPPDLAHGPVDQRRGRRRSQRVALRPPPQRGDPVARRALRRQPVVPLRHGRGGRRDADGRPGPDAQGDPRADGRQGARGGEDLRRPERHGGDHLRHRRRLLPAGGGAVAGPVLPVQVPPERGGADPADDGRGPAPERHPPGLRHAGRQPADRDDAVHRRRRRQVPGHHARHLGARAASATRRSSSRSCSTARSGRGRRSTPRTRPSPTASAAVAPRSRATSPSRRRRTSRSCSRPAPCRSSSRRSRRPRCRRRSARTR